MSLIIVDCEAIGPCPRLGELTEFGAVDFDVYRRTRKWVTFHGKLADTMSDPDAPVSEMKRVITKRYEGKSVFMEFEAWLSYRRDVQKSTRSIFVSDNPAWDFQWIHDGFHVFIGLDPFGHSGRRIGDFYAGLKRNFSKTQEWKSLRKTLHDHHPVHDAMGNAEALATLLMEPID